MTDEISLEKSKIVVLPIIFGLVILFFLKLFSIKVSLLILVVLLIVIFFISLLLSMRSKLSITSKIPTVPSITTILWVLFVTTIVIGIVALVFYQLPRSANYAGNRNQEGFGNNEYHKDYVYHFDIGEGQISVEEERLLVYGTVSIIKTDVSYQNPELEFDILVAEGETAFVEIIFRDVDITTEASLNFTVGHHYTWQTIEFGVDSQNQIWAEAFGRDPQNLQKSTCSYINTSKPFNVIVKITGDKMGNRCAVNIDNIGLGAIK